jgi:5'-3' exonuclease
MLVGNDFLPGLPGLPGIDIHSGSLDLISKEYGKLIESDPSARII